MNIKLDNKVDLRAFCLEQAVNSMDIKTSADEVVRTAKVYEEYILNGQNIPEQNFSTEKLLYETLCGTLKAMNSTKQTFPSSQATMDDKEKELIELYKKHRNQRVETENGVFYVCGYSKEFDCLIGGSIENKTSTFISSDDTIDIPHMYYTYIPKDTKFKYSRFAGI